jgi:hypothetical protein
VSVNAEPQPGDVYLRFNGRDAYVEIPSIDDYSVSTTGELTVSAWMRPDTLNFPSVEFKASLRKAAARTFEDLSKAITRRSRTSNNKNAQITSQIQDIATHRENALSAAGRVRVAPFADNRGRIIGGLRYGLRSSIFSR